MPTKSKQILTIVGRGDSHLSEDLSEIGYRPLTAQSMWTAISAMRSDHFAAVFIDVAHIDDDILELVLNIRDISTVVPVVIVGELTDERLTRALDLRTRVHRMADTDRKHLQQKAEEVLS